LACSEHARSSAHRSDRADDSAERPAARAARWDIPTQWLPQTPPALPPEPAYEKLRPAPVAAGASLPVPSARSAQFPVAPPASVDRECPSARESRADRLIFLVAPLPSSFLHALYFHPDRQTKLPPEEIPATRIPARVESQLHRKSREPQAWQHPDSKPQRHSHQVPDQRRGERGYGQS